MTERARPRPQKVSCTLLVPLALLAMVTAEAAAVPIRLHPDNPSYFLFRGQATCLVGSGEHYGAVLNLDFDYHRYLDTLAADGLDFVRLFLGPYVEKPGDFGIADNTLAPREGRLLVPWVRSDEPGYRGGGNRFDLDRGDHAYHERLTDFVREAARRGIVVEATLFSSYYRDGWLMSPLHPDNNVNGLPPTTAAEAQSKPPEALDVHQQRYVRFIVRTLNPFENVIFEIQNEPWADHPVEVDPIHGYITPPEMTHDGVRWKNRVDLASAESLAWQRRIAALIVGEESRLPNRHLISQNFGNFRYPVAEVDANVSVISFHYALPEVVRLNAVHRRAVSCNETGFAGDSDATYRRQAWELLLAGGGAFDHLDYSFAVGHEDGTAEGRSPGGGSAALRRQLGALKRFIQGFDFVHMRPDAEAVSGPPGAFASALVGEREAAIYLRRGGRPLGVAPLVIQRPAGHYVAEWIDTDDGRVVRSESLDHAGGALRITAPDFARDVALRVAPKD